MIPRQFHWVWSGSEPLPRSDAARMRTWQVQHPFWRCTLWVAQAVPHRLLAFEECEAELPGFELRLLPPLINAWAYDAVARYGSGEALGAARSDIARYELVARYGGVSLATDVECLQPLDEWLHNVRLFVCDAGEEEANTLGAGQGGNEHSGSGSFGFGAMLNHPALWRVVRELEPHLKRAWRFGGRQPSSKSAASGGGAPNGAAFNGAACSGAASNGIPAMGPGYCDPLLRAHPDCVVFPHQLFNPLCEGEDYAASYGESSAAASGTLADFSTKIS